VSTSAADGEASDATVVTQGETENDEENPT
jgi:hypothetical protein